MRAYTLEYRKQVEADIAMASVDYIKRQAKAQEPFFLFVGWTNTHYPRRLRPNSWENRASVRMAMR